MSSSPRFRRGTSIIAALVFAAVLGAIAIGLNTWRSNSVNTAALSASAETGSSLDALDTNSASNQTQTTNLASNSNTTNSQQSQQAQACTQAKASAYGTTKSPTYFKDYPLGTNTSEITNDLQIKYACTGAVLLPSKTPSNNPADYQCVGETAKITYQNSTLALDAEPDPSVTQGQCQTQICNSTGCVSAQQNATLNVSPSCNGTTQTAGNTNESSYGVAGNCSGSITQTPAVSSDNGLNLNQNLTQGSSLAVSGCGAGLPSTGAGGATTYYCDNAQDAQNQFNQLQSSGATNCQMNTADGTYVTCNATGATTQTTTPPPGGTPTNATTQSLPQNTNGSGLGNGTGSGSGAGGLGNSAGLLTSFLSGLIRGLTPCSAMPQSPYIGGTGSTLVPVQVFNPSTGMYTTTYVQQTTASPYGTTPCQQQQQAPYGVGSNGVACAAPPAVPQCAAGATAEPTSSQGNGCTDGYQCVPTSSTLGQTPTPQISCSPQTADVGQSIAITYSCENATGSSGGGFSTNNALSGTASTTIQTPPAGTNTANYGLTCTNNGQVASAQCSVQVVQPAIDLVADPQYVQSGQTSSIGWVTAGMQSCVISSPDDSNFTAANANNTSVNGVAQTDAITQNTEFDLTCETLGGTTAEASTEVSIGSATASSSAATVNVSSTADGQTINHGSTVTITWSTSNAASSTSVALWLIDLQSEQATALIADGQSTSGTYTWQVPAVGSTCSTTSYAPCAATLLDGGSYGIEAALYTPQDAYIGPPASAPANSSPPTYTDYGYTPNPFTIGQ